VILIRDSVANSRSLTFGCTVDAVWTKSTNVYVNTWNCQIVVSTWDCLAVVNTWDCLAVVNTWDCLAVVNTWDCLAVVNTWNCLAGNTNSNHDTFSYGQFALNAKPGHVLDN